MANDWIKMRSGLLNDPKVKQVGDVWESSNRFAYDFSAGATDECYVSRNALRYAVTGALHAVWSSVNEHGKEGFVAGADLEWINDIVGIGDFASALVYVGWVEQKSDGLLFPKFERNNTCGAERQRRYREKKKATSDVTRNATRDVTERDALRPREEKRREEKRRIEDTHTHTPTREAWLDHELVRESQELQDAIRFWCANFAATHGHGRDDDDIRIDMRLAEARSKGWDAAKIAKSIRFSVTKLAKSWLDPDADFEQLTKARMSEAKRKNKDLVPVEERF